MRLPGWVRRLGPLFSLAVFMAALLLLHHLLRRFHLADIRVQLGRIPRDAMLSALLLTAASYLCLGSFDGLAVRYIGKRVPLLRILLTSFVSHAVSHNTGFATLTGGAIRYRLYSAAGLAGAEVAGVVAFCGLTFGLGASSLAAGALLTEPVLLARVLHLPAGLLVVLGVVLAAAVGGYVLWGALAQKPLRLFRRHWAVPGPRLALRQILVAAADLALAGAGLYVLLPDGAQTGYPVFLGAYVVANLLGLLAHVPGGLGVFDAAILVLTPNAPPDAVFGALLLFRACYHLLPLALAAVILLLYELAERVPGLRGRLAGTLGDLGPPLLAALVFAAGALTVLVHALPHPPPGLLPEARPGLGMVQAPLGCALMSLACGLNRRIRPVRNLCLGLILLLAGVILGQDPFAPPALALLILLITLALAGEWFGPSVWRREGGALTGTLSLPWVAATAMVLALACWLTWWQAAMDGLPRSALRPALLADGTAWVVFLVALLVLPLGGRRKRAGAAR